MKICHVTSLHPPFDVRIFHKECKTLAAAGYDLTLLAQAAWPETVVDNIRIMGLPEISRRWQRPRVWQAIIQKVRALKPALVHFHNPELLLIAPLLRPAKLIYDCQEANAETMLVRRWIPAALRRPVSRLVARLEPYLARQTDAIVITEDSHVNQFAGCGRPIVLLYNYPLLSNLPTTHASDGHTLLHVGILSAGRGALTMIEAMRQVVRHKPEARLILVGPFDSPADEVEIRKLIHDYGLKQAINLVGWIPFDQLPAWFARADIGLVPWQSEKNFPPQIIPTKMFEYMGAKLPLVISNRPAVTRFIAGLDCGLVVEPEDAAGFAQAIEYLLNHPAAARQMGERGYRAVQEKYHWAVEGEKLLELYRQLA